VPSPADRPVRRNEDAARVVARRLRFDRMHVHGEMATGPGERPAGAVSLFGLAWLARDLFVPFPTGLEPNLV
jgi:hypothetical protein